MERCAFGAASTPVISRYRAFALVSRRSASKIARARGTASKSASNRAICAPCRIWSRCAWDCDTTEARLASDGRARGVARLIGVDGLSQWKGARRTSTVDSPSRLRWLRGGWRKVASLWLCDQSRASLVGEVRICPLHQDGQAVSESGEQHDVQQQPAHPRDPSHEVNATEVGDR